MSGQPEHIRPKKRLGQNFLTDRNIAEKIVRSVNPAPGETILEIGPGEGALTELLVEAGADVLAVEVDPEAAEHLRHRFGEKITLVEDDFLQVDLSAVPGMTGPIRVVGNIPYYITSPILFRLLEQSEAVRQATLMMQKEVAARLVAARGSKEYGILTVTIEAYGSAKRLFDVPASCFYPRPRVTSSVVSIEIDPSERLIQVREEFHRLLRAAFGKRRKTLNNSLASVVPEADRRAGLFEAAGIDPGLRAERLSAEDFIRLAEASVR